MLLLCRTEAYTFCCPGFSRAAKGWGGGRRVVGGVTVSFFFFFFLCVCWAALLRLACPRASGLFIETQHHLYGEGRGDQSRAELADYQNSTLDTFLLSSISKHLKPGVYKYHSE